MFGRVEKILRKNVTIISKEKYYKVYKTIENVQILGTDCELLNTKSLDKFFKNLQCISELKRVVFEKNMETIKVKGFRNYRFEDQREQVGEKLLKKGVKVSNVKKVVLESLPLNHHISAEKKKDVEKLLRVLYGEEWKKEPDHVFKWYKTIICETPASVEDEEEVCECDCLRCWDEDLK